MNDLPVHFFTIVLNGEPLIRYHLEAFRNLPFSWHWHIIEGVADLSHDTAWSVADGGRIGSNFHTGGKSNDGTSGYLDEIAVEHGANITLYRKSAGVFWDGKLEMVSAPLPNLPAHCLLWQIDVDEFWSQAQIIAARNLFLARPEKTAAWFWCHYFVGPGLITREHDGYGQHSDYEWLRIWNYRKPMHWASHEPPRLIEKNADGKEEDVGKKNPFLHHEMEKAGLVFQHYAYVLPKQLEFKESYYGYKDALASWQKLQSALERPLRLKNYLPWVNDETTADSIESQSVVSIARFESGSCRFLPQDQIKSWRSPDPLKVRMGMLTEHFRFRLRKMTGSLIKFLDEANAASTRFLSRHPLLWQCKSLLTVFLVDFVALSFVRHEEANTVAIIKVDRLGDYILVRRYLRLLRSHPAYRDSKMVLCANIQLKDFIETYDGDFFDRLIWIDRDRLINQPRYRFNILREIRQHGAKAALHPTYAREPLVGDSLLRATKAAERFGFESYQMKDSSATIMQRLYTRIADHFYTRLVSDDRRVVFEFDRYKSFFSTLFPEMEMPRDTRFTAIPAQAPAIETPFVVLLPGGNQDARSWPPERYGQLARRIHATHGLKIVLLGSATERPNANLVQETCPEVPMDNLCGELSLPQMIDLMSRCIIGIGNESGGIHLLAALDRLGIAVANGNRFGWFYPYPPEMLPSVRYVYPPSFDEGLNSDQRKLLYQGAKLESLETLSAEAVLALVTAILQDQNRARN